MSVENHSAEFRRAMENLDAAQAIKLWAHVFPHLPAIHDRAGALAMLHHARTQAPILADKLRFYSHRWLLDHGLPSGLPDHLKPRAEREYPRIVKGVGIAVRSSEAMKPFAVLVRGAMESAVLEADADGLLDDVEHVRRRMAEARAREVKKLVG